jgi:hypothetical protein
MRESGYSIDPEMLYNFFSKIMNSQPKEKADLEGLQLSPIDLKEEYRKEWNAREKDFVVLTKKGELVNNSIYRVGGIGCKPDGKNYFMLLKYVEDFYEEEILKMSSDKNPKHLCGRWCILDKDGVEKIVLSKYESPHLIKGSCIYGCKSEYHNIETGEWYGRASTTMESEDFLFLDRRYDTDKEKRGVMKINKKDGTWELFK